MRYLLDSGILTDFVQGREPVISRAREAVLAGHVVGVCTPVIGEFTAGLMGSNDPAKNLRRFNHKLRHLRVWTYDHAAAEAYGVIHGDLRERGLLIQVVDMQTAAVAKALSSCTVVTTDSDFDRIPGLNTVDWSK